MPEIVADAERMLVPKPGPDQVVLAICGDDGAICWTIGDKATMGEPGIMGALIGCLEDGQRILRERPPTVIGGNSFRTFLTP
jgi:hypothetical protein